MNETIEGRAPGGHGGDANGDREGVITLVSNRQELVRRLSTLSRARNQAWFNSVGNQARAEALPSELATVDFGRYPKPQAIPSLGSCKKDRGCLPTERRTKARSRFPQSGRTSYTVPSANECQGTPLSSLPHQPGQAQDRLRVLRTGKAAGHSLAGRGSNGSRGQPRHVTLFPA